jgi:hypothetical protein
LTGSPRSALAEGARSLNHAYLLKKTHSAISRGMVATRRLMSVMPREFARFSRKNECQKNIHESLTLSGRQFDTFVFEPG